MLDAGGDEILGTDYTLMGDYETVANFIKHRVNKAGHSGMVYQISKQVSTGHYVFMKHHHVRGDMSEWNKQRFAGHKVTLDGKPALVTGTRLEHAKIRTNNGEVEFAWPTVAWICSTKQGKFTS